jgi:hypothetical protein
MGACVCGEISSHLLEHESLILSVSLFPPLFRAYSVLSSGSRHLVESPLAGVNRGGGGGSPNFFSLAKKVYLVRFYNY